MSDAVLTWAAAHPVATGAIVVVFIAYSMALGILMRIGDCDE